MCGTSYRSRSGRDVRYPVYNNVGAPCFQPQSAILDPALINVIMSIVARKLSLKYLFSHTRTMQRSGFWDRGVVATIVVKCKRNSSVIDESARNDDGEMGREARGG